LADTLIGNYQENRPVTLIGYSLGARVIYYCLRELAEKNKYGIVEDVYIIGTPVMESIKDWEQCCSVVSGRFVNGYITHDWVLGFLYRASSGSFSTVAGLAPIQVDRIENVCLDEIVNGHLDYRRKIPLILKKFGFIVTSETFETEEESQEKERLSREEGIKMEEEKARMEEENEKLEKAASLRKTRSMSNESSGGLKRIGSWFKSFTPTSSKRKSQPVTMTPEEELLEIEKEEELERERLKKEIEEFCKPKEIASTLPKLVISSAISDENIDKGEESSSSSSPEPVITPLEIKSNMPRLVVRLSRENLHREMSKINDDESTTYFIETDDDDTDDKELCEVKKIPSNQPTIQVSMREKYRSSSFSSKRKNVPPALNHIEVIGEESDSRREKITDPSSPTYLSEIYNQMNETAQITDTNLLFDDGEEDDEENGENVNESYSSTENIISEEEKVNNETVENNNAM